MPRAGPSPEQLLQVWERGLGQAPPLRTLALLAAALPDRAPQELAGLAPGRCDAELMGWFEFVCGPEAEVVAPCPGCGMLVEAAVDVRDLRVAAPPVLQEDPPQPLRVEVDGEVVAFRLPTVADLAAVARQHPAPDGLVAAADLLLRRCLFDPDRAPAGARAAVAERMAAADPQADVDLALRCPACGREWAVPFDVEGLLWAEIDAAARALLREVHALAGAYGWREADVLGLSPARRRAYLELVAG